MEKKFDVTALGELLVDFTSSGASAQGNVLFEANPGGAPCNLLAMLSSLGHSTAFLGKVGADMFGAMLRERAAAVGIDMSGLVMDPEALTTLAFVRNSPDGEREFSFYRRPGADQLLRPEELDLDKVRQARVFHFGTLSMTAEPSRSATAAAVAAAGEAGCLLSFDPNLREALWPDPDRAREAIRFGLERCHVLKISDNELTFLTGLIDPKEAVAALLGRYPIPLVLATLGPKGSLACYRGRQVFAPACLRPDTVDTTGAGDTFGGCALHFVLERGLEALTNEDLMELLTFSNAAASLITARRGALSVMPRQEDILTWRAVCFG